MGRLCGGGEAYTRTRLLLGQVRALVGVVAQRLLAVRLFDLVLGRVHGDAHKGRGLNARHVHHGVVCNNPGWRGEAPEQGLGAGVAAMVLK